jgi:hypothetical protein
MQVTSFGLNHTYQNADFGATVSDSTTQMQAQHQENDLEAAHPLTTGRTRSSSSQQRTRHIYPIRPESEQDYEFTFSNCRFIAGLVAAACILFIPPTLFKYFGPHQN